LYDNITVNIKVSAQGKGDDWLRIASNGGLWY